MKKIFIILFISSSLFSDGLYSTADISYKPMNKTGFIIPEGIYFQTNIVLGYEYNGVYLQTILTTEMIKYKKHMFSPFLQDYKIQAGYKYKMFYVEYSHLCGHGIYPTKANYGYDKITIGYDTRWE